MPNDTLESYREKRNFSRTDEPQGGTSDRNGGETEALPRFVIHEHGASSHHFDFRLEVEGVLRSWAVPKGPSTDPREKRLAIPTEDHPLEYGDFEGVIPEGEYGAGPTIVWDAGTYRNLKADEESGQTPRSLPEQLGDGHVTVWLEGEKLRGGYTLQRFREGGEGGDGEEQWLLTKMDDEEADARRNPVSTEPESVKTGRTLEEVRDEEGEGDEGEGDEGAGGGQGDA